MASDNPLEKASIYEHVESSNGEVGKEISDEERRRVVRKIDVHLLPFISVLYLLSFLDRANIGNAKIAGMAHDAHLVGLKYNIVAAVFFIPYALAEVPSNVLLKLVRPSRWIPSIMVAWGFIMTLMCLCKTFKSLVIARVFLGLAESGLFPGVTFYLSLWYRRRDVAFRIAIFFSAATVAGAFGGILAYGIEHMEGIAGLHGWQWIFCLEGIATILVAFLSYFFMHDYPSTATFLTAHEKQIIAQMLKEDTLGLATHYDKKFIWQALLDYNAYILCILYMGCLVPVYAIALFLPTIINTLGYSAANAQLLTIPPFAAGCAATIAVGYFSDKHNKRGIYVIGSCVVSLVGYIILITQTKAGASYGGTVIAAVGVYPTIAVILAWAGASAGGDVRKGVTLAMVIGLGNLGGICSSFIYLKAPRFFVGHGTIIGFLSLTIILSSFCIWNFNRLNKKKEAHCVIHGIDDSRRGEFVNLGSESPLFRYTL